MLKKALISQRKKGGSLLAFNVQNFTHLEILQNAVKDINKPVIAQFSSRYITYWDQRIGLSQLVKKYQKNGVYFHLDHCNDAELIKFCIDAGFAGVMFDGSSLPIHENIRVSNEIAKYIKSNRNETILEVEIGAIKGVEDGYSGSEKADYYSKEDLDEIVRNADFDVLALAIGNAHGMYESTSEIKPELLKKATEKYPNINLVLHGGTGLPEDMILECIDYGVVKINVSTELKLQTHKAMRSYINKFGMFNENVWNDHANGIIRPFFKDFINKYTK